MNSQVIDLRLEWKQAPWAPLLRTDVCENGPWDAVLEKLVTASEEEVTAVELVATFEDKVAAVELVAAFEDEVAVEELVAASEDKVTAVAAVGQSEDKVAAVELVAAFEDEVAVEELVAISEEPDVVKTPSKHLLPVLRPSSRMQLNHSLFKLLKVTLLSALFITTQATHFPFIWPQIPSQGLSPWTDWCSSKIDSRLENLNDCNISYYKITRTIISVQFCEWLRVARASMVIVRPYHALIILVNHLQTTAEGVTEKYSK